MEEVRIILNGHRARPDAVRVDLLHHPQHVVDLVPLHVRREVVAHLPGRVGELVDIGDAQVLLGYALQELLLSA